MIQTTEYINLIRMNFFCYYMIDEFDYNNRKIFLSIEKAI